MLCGVMLLLIRYIYICQQESINVFILVHLSVLEFASVGLALFRFALTKGTGVPENNALS